MDATAVCFSLPVLVWVGVDRRLVVRVALGGGDQSEYRSRSAMPRNTSPRRDTFSLPSRPVTEVCGKLAAVHCLHFSCARSRRASLCKACTRQRQGGHDVSTAKGDVSQPASDRRAQSSWTRSRWPAGGGISYARLDHWATPPSLSISSPGRKSIHGQGIGADASETPLPVCALALSRCRSHRRGTSMSYVRNRVTKTVGYKTRLGRKKSSWHLICGQVVVDHK